MLTNIRIFCPYICNSKEKIKKIEENVTMKLKMNFPNHWLMVRLNLILSNVRNCDASITVVNEYEKIVNCKKKGIL